MTNRPQGSPGASHRSYLMPRRLSYATVAAGIAAASQNNQPPPLSRRSLTHLLNATPSSPTHSPQGSLDQPQRMSHSVSDSDAHMDNGINIPGTWGRGSGGNYTSQYFHGYGLAGSGGAHNSGFFKPTYLRESKYMEKLEAAHKAKLAAQREAHSAHSSNPGSLSTSSSSVSLHKMAPSHRGMTYEIIEHQMLVDDESLTPLPSKWAEADKSAGLEIGADGLDVKYVGLTKLHDHEAASARADNPMPPQCGIYYFEVTIVSKGKEGMIGVGFSGAKASLEKFPGWEPESWAYHGDDGKSFCCQSTGKLYGDTFTTGDIIGCGVNFMSGSAFFTKNGVFQGDAFSGLKDVNLYPSVGMKRPQAHLSVNFGQKPFVFDIDGMMSGVRSEINKDINSIDVSKIHPHLDENTLLKELVAQFLAHEGYVETGKAFAEEVQTEDGTLRSGRGTSLENYAVEEDIDAGNRQQIRTAILEGDIDMAMKRTNTFYPHVLEQNPHTHFRLRCRKFVEMIRQSTELSEISAEKRSRPLNGHSAVQDDDFEPDMDMDETMNNGDDWDQMETEEGDHELKHQPLLDDTVRYGQELKYDYKDDHSKYVQDALKEIFSMFAYEDIRKSPTSHLIDPSGRVPVAEELNSAILVSLGKSSSAAIERLYQQTEVLVNDISDEGGAGAFINVRHDFLRQDFQLPYALANGNSNIKREKPSPEDPYLSYHDILCGGESTSILTYAAANLEILVVTKEDVDTLKDDWLTDNVIAFWEEFLEQEYLKPFPRSNIVLLRPSMSFMLIQTPDPLTLREALPDFSQTTHIFLPINDCRNVEIAEGGTHWSLLVVSVVDGISFHYDSLYPANRSEASTASHKIGGLLGKLLQFMDLQDSPRQDNSSDCGVFVCVQMRHLVKRLLKIDSRTKISMSMGGKVIDAAGGRKEMLRIIENFRKEGEKRRSGSMSPHKNGVVQGKVPPRIDD